MLDSANWILIVAGGLLILLEVIIGAASGFDFLLIGSAVLLGGVLGLATHSPLLGTAAAGTLAIAYVLIGRRRIRARWARHGIESNADAVVGRTGRVLEAIEGSLPGRVEIDGEQWRARPARSQTQAETIASGRIVRVVRIDGVTVYVEPADGSIGGSGA